MKVQRVRIYEINNEVVPKIITDSQQLILFTAELFNIKTSVLISSCRLIELVAIRQSIMWICRRKLKMTLSSVGREMNRDHSTIIHGVKSVDNWIELPNQYKEQMNIYNHIMSNSIFTNGVSKSKSVQYVKSALVSLQAELNRLEAMDY